MNVTILHICMYSWVQKVIILFNFYLIFLYIFLYISNYSYYFYFFLFFLFFQIIFIIFQNYHQYSLSVLRIHYRRKKNWKKFFDFQFWTKQSSKEKKLEKIRKSIIYKIHRHSFSNCEARLSRTVYWLNNGRRKRYFLSSESSAMGKGGIRFLNWDALCFQGNYDTP